MGAWLPLRLKFRLNPILVKTFHSNIIGRRSLSVYLSWLKFPLLDSIRSSQLLDHLFSFSCTLNLACNACSFIHNPHFKISVHNKFHQCYCRERLIFRELSVISTFLVFPWVAWLALILF